MKIQLLTQEKKVLCELEKSKLFPYYRSVLKEAIAYSVDLNGLYIESECIDDVIWIGVNMHSKVVYAIDSDSVWWKPYSWNDQAKKIFRGTLEHFSHEVQNGFPTTDLYAPASTRKH